MMGGMSDLTIWIGNKNYSSWSLRAWLAVERCGAFDEVMVDIDTPMPHPAPGGALPAGRVPVIRHGDLVVWDSLAICEYLAETFPAARLWPADRAARARARSACAEMHSGFQALRTNMPMNVRRRAPGKGQAPGVADDVARIQALWRECRAAAKGGPFLFDDFTVADAFFAPVVTRFRTYGVELDAVARAYSDAVFAHPAMARWCADAEQESARIEKYET